jgi:hypothetical protein
MVKAHITKPSGTKIVVEGTTEEIAAILLQIETETQQPKQSAAPNIHSKNPPSRGRTTPVNLISTLIDGGFFRTPRDLASVKIALEEMGHHYPVTSLSPTLLRLVRKRQLRRIRDQKRWTYTA